MPGASLWWRMNVDSGRIEHDVVIREMRPDEKAVLPEFLYEAIFVPEGMEAPDRTIVEQPELSLYFEGFGKDRLTGASWRKCPGALSERCGQGS
ncbi:hypothetical protein SAMN02910456_02596 [Ruminococcaceae bacterium YRB3002]|nr:hypothetical protein SAMN02910456_02596 [Ruminococcaceae bacterium YRB3002]